MTVISRLQLDHPALGTAGGAGLHASISALYQKIGDNLADRILVAVDLADSATATVEHNYKTALSNIRYDLYLYDEGTTALTRITASTSPSISQFTIVATPGFETTKIDITNNSGAQRDLALVTFIDPVQLDELTDVDISTVAPQEGQALVYDSVSGLWKPGASGDASFKVQSVTTPNAVIKGGYLFIDDERELATHDGGADAAANFGTDLTVNLTTIFGSAPADATTYYLYLDLQTLGASVLQTDTGRKVYKITQSNMVLSTLTPEVRDPRRYVPIGFVRSATSGTVWSGAGAAFGTLAFRRHETLTRFFAYPETFVDESITTAVASTTLNHNLSGEPHAIYLTYDDATTEIGLDLSAHLLDVTATQIKIASLGLTLSGTQKVRVRAVRFPQQPALASLSRTFTSAWFQNTATTVVPHGLNDRDDIRGYEVQEWNVTTGKIRNIDRSALVVDFDATNFTLNWTGLTPSATLQYRVVAGGSPIPHAIPIEYGGYTKFVGIGPGSYATLTAAIAAAAPGDSILVARDTTEPAGDLTLGVAGIRIRQMPNTKVGMSGAMTNGLRVTAAKVRWEAMLLELNPSGTQARGISVEAADSHVEGKVEKIGAQTVTDGVHVTSGSSRTYGSVAIQVVAGAVTNLLNNLDGASNVNVWGG